MEVPSGSELLMLDVEPAHCARLVEVLSLCSSFRVQQPTAARLAAASVYHPPVELRTLTLCPAGVSWCAALKELLEVVGTGIRYIQRLYVVGGESGGAAEDEGHLISAIVQKVRAVGEGCKLRLQAGNAGMTQRVGEALAAAGAEFSPTEFTHLLSVCGWPYFHEQDPKQILFGLVARADVDNFGSLHRAAQAAGEAATCRARFKLVEALTLPEVVAGLASKTSPGGFDGSCVDSNSCVVAVDLGAAPGGWTEVMASSPVISRVFAVDPGQLDSSIEQMEKVEHLCMKGEQAVTALLARASARPVGLVVCDVNFDPRNTAHLVASTAPLLEEGALLVMTIKLPRQSSVGLIDKLAGECIAILEAVGFGSVRVRHLLANTRSERTATAVFTKTAGTRRGDVETPAEIDAVASS